MTTRAIAGALAAATLFTCVPGASADPDAGQITYYLSQLDSMGVNRPDDQLSVQVGQAVCQHLADGLSVDAIIRQAINSSFSGRDAGTLLSVSVSAFCPDKTPALQRWISEHS